MKKKKLKLNELNVKSFTTSAKEIRGGIFTYHPTQDCPTQHCDSHLECATILEPGDFGICAPQKL
ncbi:MAG: pinensin family lanthipeptide [Bacteroidota bacterium]